MATGWNGFIARHQAKRVHLSFVDNKHKQRLARNECVDVITFSGISFACRLQKAWLSGIVISFHIIHYWLKSLLAIFILLARHSRVNNYQLSDSTRQNIFALIRIDLNINIVFIIILLVSTAVTLCHYLGNNELFRFDSAERQKTSETPLGFIDERKKDKSAQHLLLIPNK